MSVFKRAEWSSGLTYRQVCDQCNTTFTYTDDKLDFRPWYADGFVYCPCCMKPVRHAERFAINGPAANVGTASAQPAGRSSFCTDCGKQFAESDKFCAACGKKR